MVKTLSSLAQGAGDLTKDQFFVRPAERLRTYGPKGQFGQSLINPAALGAAVRGYQKEYGLWLAANPEAPSTQRMLKSQELEALFEKNLDKEKLVGAGDANATNAGNLEGETTEDLLKRRQGLTKPNNQGK